MKIIELGVVLVSRNEFTSMPTPMDDDEIAALKKLITEVVTGNTTYFGMDLHPDTERVYIKAERIESITMTVLAEEKD